MKAKEALRVQGTMTYRGFIPMDWDIEARTGRKRVAVATLLVHSVKMAISRHRMMAMAQGGMLWRGVIWSPIHIDRPDSSLPLARANPPPKRRTMLQGNFFWATFQVSRAGVGPAGC